MPNAFDIESTRRDLIAKRVKFGADSPKGRACSNLIAADRPCEAPCRATTFLTEDWNTPHGL